MARNTRLLMGMPISLDLVECDSAELLDDVFGYFADVEARFSLYRADSEISSINLGTVAPAAFSAEMREVLALAEQTRVQTNGYFDIRRPDGALDPSGIVKGWAIRNAAERIRQAGLSNFMVEAGGDIQTGGKNREGQDWRVGIRNPFNESEIIKAVSPRGRGIATSGSYVRGGHIYNPHEFAEPIETIVSLTVIGPDILEADRFATAAFAMGTDGIGFIEQQDDFEGYVVDARRIATQTSGFGAYVIT